MKTKIDDEDDDDDGDDDDNTSLPERSGRGKVQVQLTGNRYPTGCLVG